MQVALVLAKTTDNLMVLTSGRKGRFAEQVAKRADFHFFPRFWSSCGEHHLEYEVLARATILFPHTNAHRVRTAQRYLHPTKKGPSGADLLCADVVDDDVFHTLAQSNALERTRALNFF